MATYVEVTDTIKCQPTAPSHSVSNGKMEKKDKIPEALVKRHEARLARLEKQKEERENSTVQTESAEFFSKTFHAEKAVIEERLATAENVDKSSLNDFFDDLTELAQKLQKYVTDTSPFLPSYDIRNSQEQLSKLIKDINEKRDVLMPKKKFAFKARKRGEEQTIQQPRKIGTDDVDAAKPLNVMTANACGFSNRTAETLCLSAEEMHAKDVGLSNLTSCVVKLQGCPSALHISNITDCKIFCGPIPGSVFVDRCLNSTLVLACQQLRVHNTSGTRFYIHVTSRAIIEDTSMVSFAPFNWKYDGLEQDYERSGLDRSKNAWNDIDDFNWLAHNKRSPHWDLIPEADRVQKWD
ncbi:tubulin-specific chaperone C-like [Diadema antillarum]|uniref:tubulin-specific chaperone C-like n=1 Tax=Diadema antillarum TaxID=105358 RepID=UPI003A85DE1B